jgi:mRNA-degrading endonuclease RelE of RelBE toxin-antitoxin system
MKVEYAEDFDKSLKKIKDKIALKRLHVLIEKLKRAQNLSEISNVMAITNYPGRYRIRTGDYRLIVSYWMGEIKILLIEYLKRDDNTYRKYN